MQLFSNLKLISLEQNMQNLFPGMTTPEPGLVPCIKKQLSESISDSCLYAKLIFQIPLPTANTEQKSIGIL